jgi:hypothetical protein
LPSRKVQIKREKEQALAGDKALSTKAASLVRATKSRQQNERRGEVK